MLEGQRPICPRAGSSSVPPKC